MAAADKQGIAEKTAAEEKALCSFFSPFAASSSTATDRKYGDCSIAHTFVFTYIHTSILRNGNDQSLLPKR